MPCESVAWHLRPQRRREDKDFSRRKGERGEREKIADQRPARRGYYERFVVSAVHGAWDVNHKDTENTKKNLCVLCG
jgi:hypothetical protein